MKRGRVLSVLLILLVASSILGGSWWLLRTEEGARWTMKTVSRLSSGAVAFEGVNGIITKILHIEKINVKWAQGRIDIKGFRSCFMPLHLLTGAFEFREIAAERVAIEVTGGKQSTTDLRIPKINGLLTRLSCGIRSLLVNEVSFQSGSDSPFTMKDVSAKIDWQQGSLKIEDMRLKSDMADGQGSLSLNFIYPAFYLNFAVNPREQFIVFDSLLFHAMLQPGRGNEQTAGTVSFTGMIRSKDAFIIKSDIGVTPQGLNVRNLLVMDPHRKGTVKGQGTVAFSADAPDIRLTLRADEVDLSGELVFFKRLSGDIIVRGAPQKYSGTYSFVSPSDTWHANSLAGSFEGSLEKIYALVKDGRFADGLVKGDFGFDWAGKMSFEASLQGTGINPSRLTPRLKGNVNMNAATRLIWPDKGPLEGKITARLLDSTLHEKHVTGDMDALVENENFIMKNAEIRGKGFSISAGGSFNERFDFEILVDDMKNLLSETEGSLASKGWVRWRNDKFTGMISASGKGLSSNGLSVGHIHAEGQLDDEKKGLVNINVKARNITGNSVKADTFTINIAGLLGRHGISISANGPDGKMEAKLFGSCQAVAWNGAITMLYLDYPKGKPWSLQSRSELAIAEDRFSLSPFILSSSSGERLEIKADVTRTTSAGFFQADWKHLDLARANPFFKEQRLTGQSTGNLHIRFIDEKRMNIAVSANAAGSVDYKKTKLRFSKGTVHIDGSEKGLEASLDIKLTEGGFARGFISSPVQLRPAFPSRGTFSVSLDNINLSLISPLLPKTLLVDGFLVGGAEGSWAHGSKINARGSMTVNDGFLSWQEKGGSVRLNMKEVSLKTRLADETLKGDLSMDLEQKGFLKGEFSVKRNGPIRGSLKGKFHEKGLIPALFPDAVQGTTGTLSLALGVAGTWDMPTMKGSVNLSRAGGYIPVAGIRLEDVNALFEFDEDQIRMTSLQARSGQGSINGVASLSLKDWKISRFKGNLKGERFQAVYLPNVQVTASPKLDFEGTARKVTVHGNIGVPEASISGVQRTGVLAKSSDVVIVDVTEKQINGPSFPLDAKVRVTLGDKVIIKAGGIEGRLAGAMDVNIRNTKDIAVTGEIKIVNGLFNSYGQKLDIERGRLTFSGPPENPSLDVLALKKIGGLQSLEDRVGDVKAGVLVTGNIQSPFIKLYSQPAMPDVDILSYLVLGQRTTKGDDKENTGALMRAVGLMAYDGLSNKMLGQARLINSLDIQASGADLSESLITVGKQINPRLYMGLGGSLFNNIYQIIFRYALTKNVEVETKSGTQSGGNIYYKIEFH